MKKRRVLLIDDEPMEWAMRRRFFPEYEWHWLPAIASALDSIVLARKYYERIFVDVMGTSPPGKWTKEVKKLIDKADCPVVAISHSLQPIGNISNLLFVEKRHFNDYMKSIKP